MTLTGQQIIGATLAAEGKEVFYAYHPATGEKGSIPFYKATNEEVNKAVAQATAAFAQYRKKTGAEKAVFLEAIATAIQELGDELIETAHLETALPKPRLEGERDRTTNQLKLFAALVREGSWMGVRIDTALPDRKPLPRPDLRQMQIPLGPVVVFSASNFPLAFSVAGGDTTSALAAGCTVIVKAHEAHPATSELVGRAIQKAAIACSMPDGVFSLLQGEGKTVGIALVNHPNIKAVGFTGSYTAGKAIFDTAQRRPEPIPVYAEMGSTNPVFVLPGAIQQRANEIARNFAASVCLGVGQFCTNPGLLFYEQDSHNLTHYLKEEFSKTSGGHMLTEAMGKTYNHKLSQHSTLEGVEVLAAGSKAEDKAVQPMLLKTNKSIFLNKKELEEEIFGPTSTIVETGSKEEMMNIARNLTGHLTATVHGTEEDLVAYQDLLEVLQQKVGRVVINGFPTGVEVCHAMVHGGPFPATTDARTTSVGTTAIYRFTRPVCFQNYPKQLLPAELADDNPLQIWRMVNGNWTKDVVPS